ncbi:hypothetical protein BGZ96_007779 [Linnemannia gamsii]|uniref:AIG1-type G domain-containing protein n=1 Tax=Linnemannia gamsii TaxID=64522 RepID=A0ABQ7KFC5_9FUNG|nr:hypothetical protein BGZ96_007779 [Linnemannia gamsii]
MANVQRSPSDSSNHNLHLKTSYTSMHNHYNPYNTTTSASANHMMAGAHDTNNNNNNNNNNYKVPLDSNDANVKVPVLDSTTAAARPTNSHTYSNNSNASNASNYTTTSNGSIGGLNRNISSGRDSSDWRNAQHTQAPRTIAATKPTVGAFPAATVHATGDYPATTSNSNNNYAHYNNNNANNGQGGVVTVSTTSSASPSRSSSTSNRGGAGVSTGGSFTPQSATPPMTPRMVPGVADAAFSPGHEHATNNDASARDRYSYPSGPHHGHLTSPALHVQPQSSSSSSSAYANNNHNNNTSLPPFGIDESAASAFVSSPVTYQPSAFQTFYTQEGTQQPVTTGAGATEHDSSADSLHRAKSIVNAGRETLVQQLEYQNRQMEQFRENLDGISLDSHGSQQSTPHPTNDSGSSFSNGGGSQPSLNAHPPALASAVAIAASLAGVNGSTDGPRLHEDIQTSTMDQPQPPRPRDRTISEGESDHGSRLDIANNVGLSAASLGGSSLFSPPLRTNTALVASNLVTHDIRQTSQRSHIEDGPGPVVLIAIGKTGQGKSSLLNKIMGTSELKASASVRAVTKGIAERSGWGRFEDSRRVLVTVADTPGLADTEGDDEKNIPILKEYIRSIGTRLGVNAFLLVFKIDSGVDMIITILTAFNDIMKDFPNFWDNVVLVFTGCDYRRNVMHTKQLYHGEIQAQLEEHFLQDLRRPGPGSSRYEDDDSSSESGKAAAAKAAANDEEEAPTPIIPMVFLSCAEAPCGFSLGERCDCKARTTFLNAGIKRLWYKVREKKRWVLDQDEDDDLNGHS